MSPPRALLLGFTLLHSNKSEGLWGQGTTCTRSQLWERSKLAPPVLWDWEGSGCSDKYLHLGIFTSRSSAGKTAAAHAQSLTFLTIRSAKPNGFKVLSAPKRVTKHNNGHFLFSRCDLQSLCAQLCVFRPRAVDFSKKMTCCCPAELAKQLFRLDDVSSCAAAL